MNKPELDSMIGDWLKNNLRLEVTEETTSQYTGGLDGSGSLYRDSKYVNIRLLADINEEEIVIDEVGFSID